MKAVLIVDYISNSAEYTILCTLLVFQKFLLLEHCITCRFLIFFFFFRMILHAAGSVTETTLKKFPCIQIFQSQKNQQM